MSDPTITAVDEVFDASGRVVSSSPRVVRQTPTVDDIATMRRNLRLVATNSLPGANVPVWGQIIARALLAYTWTDENHPPVSAPVRTARRLDERGYDLPEGE